MNNHETFYVVVDEHGKFLAYDNQGALATGYPMLVDSVLRAQKWETAAAAEKIDASQKLLREVSACGGNPRTTLTVRRATVTLSPAYGPLEAF